MEPESKHAREHTDRVHPNEDQGKDQLRQGTGYHDECTGRATDEAVLDDVVRREKRDRNRKEDTECGAGERHQKGVERRLPHEPRLVDARCPHPVEQVDDVLPLGPEGQRVHPDVPHAVETPDDEDDKGRSEETATPRDRRPELLFEAGSDHLGDALGLGGGIGFEERHERSVTDVTYSEILRPSGSSRR